MALPRLQTVTARPTEPLLEQILQVTGRLPITLGMATPTNIFVHTNDLIATSLSTIYHGQGTITKPGEAGTVNIVQRTVAMLKPGQWVRRTAYTRITDTAPNTELEIDLLKHLFTFRKPSAVVAFLQQYPFLVWPLVITRTQIQDYFADAPVYLKVMSDPEYADDRELVIYIATDLPVSRAIERFDELEAVWWSRTSVQARSMLGITLEYR